jgi:Cytochrome C oxidase, cbb3-type, subunit III
MRHIPGRILLHWLAAGCVVGATSAARKGAAGAGSITDLTVSSARDTPPGGTRDRSPDSSSSRGPRVSAVEYEGWRQYSVHCARCHGQDVLPNPVAANLLVSLAAGGAIDSPEKFAQVVTEGRPHRGMPSFKKTLTSPQIRAVYAYVKGRADKRIPPGRPEKPSG